MNDNPFDLIPGFNEVEDDLKEIADSGYNLVLRSHSWTTGIAHCTYPQGFQDEYDRNHLVVMDPMMLWAMTNTGTTRWSEIDTAAKVVSDHVISRALHFGLAFGGIAVRRSRALNNRKCILSVARADRELTDAEIVRIGEILEHVIASHERGLGLSVVELKTIEALAAGLSQDEIATKFESSRDTVKKRIERIRKKLGAKNATHVVSIALSHRLIGSG